MNICLSAVDFIWETGSGIVFKIVTTHLCKLLLFGVKQSIVYHLTTRSTKCVQGGTGSCSRLDVMCVSFSGVCVFGIWGEEILDITENQSCTRLWSLEVLNLILLLSKLDFYKLCAVVVSSVQRKSCLFICRGKQNWRLLPSTSCFVAVTVRHEQWNLIFGLPSLKAKNSSPVMQGKLRILLTSTLGRLWDNVMGGVM